MASRTYSDQQRAAAMVHAQRHGNGAAARKFGFPRTTIQKWMQSAGVEPGTTALSGKTAKATEASRTRREYLRERLRTRLLEEANWALDRIHKPHIDFKGDKVQKITYPVAPASAVQAYATTAGILIDKYRLEVGEATSRNESRDLTHDDHETELFRDAIRRELELRRSEAIGRTVDGPVETGADSPAVEADAPAGSGAPAG